LGLFGGRGDYVQAATFVRRIGDGAEVVEGFGRLLSVCDIQAYLYESVGRVLGDGFEMGSVVEEMGVHDGSGGVAAAHHWSVDHRRVDCSMKAIERKGFVG
jgi:hypothetical protein